MRIADSSRLSRLSPVARERLAFGQGFASGQYDLRLDPGALMCTAQGCAIRADGQALYLDQTQLSAYAARPYGVVFDPVFASTRRP